MTKLRALPGRPAYPFVDQQFRHQLEMIRPSSAGLVEVPRLPEEYSLREFRAGDEHAYDDLFHLAFADEGRFPETLARTLPGGFFVVEHLPSQDLVASCVAMHGSSSPRHQAGQLGWLVTDPSHTRRGLGRAVCAAVINRFIQEGYECPFLGTEDFRIPAIALYLSLGWRPYIYRDDMAPRWRMIYSALGRKFDSS